MQTNFSRRVIMYTRRAASEPLFELHDLTRFRHGVYSIRILTVNKIFQKS